MAGPENEIVLPSAYIRELYETYQTMAEACLRVKDAVRSDRGKYPVYVPPFGFTEEDKISNEAREAAINSMTQLFVLGQDEYVPEAGILCASPGTVSAVERLNTAKMMFKKAVMAIRNFQTETDATVSRITKLIRDEVTEKGYRTEALKKAMGTAGIGSLDLRRCYALIRIMPPDLDVFSWTWATNHSRIKKVTLNEALEMAKKLPEKETSETAQDLLNRCNPGEALVRRVSLPNQLRANYAYKEDGDIIRKSCPISGVVVAQQQHMPRKLWRDNPGQNSELPRLPRESGIEDDVFIQALDLHRYVR